MVSSFKLSGLCCISSLMLLLFGCGDEEISELRFGIDALEASLGGPVGLATYIQGASLEEISDRFSEYEVEYIPDSYSSDIRTCPKYFSSELVDGYYVVEGEHYYIDEYGRPDRVFVAYPPIETERRATTCQRNVGQWGDTERPENDYDGGHLIGSQLGGWGARANLVPQDVSFNRGQYVRIENKIADCGELDEGQLLYYVRVIYPDSESLVPEQYLMILHDMRTGDQLDLSFENIDQGGESGEAQADRAVIFLDAMGCS